MTAVIAEPALRSASWDDLARMWSEAVTDAEREEVLSEGKRRDHLEAQRKARNAERGEWLDAAHAQYMAAEAELRGNLVRYGSPVADAWALWSGSERYAMAHCSEELRLWWLDHPRITVTAWREQVSNGKRIQVAERDAETTTQEPTEGETVIGHLAGEAVRAGVRTASNLSREQRIQAQQMQAATDRAQQAVSQRAGEIRTGLAVRAPAALVRKAEPVDGAETLEYARRFLSHMCVFPSPAALVTTVLWIGHAHARDASGRLAWLCSPRLLFSSAQPGSGKSHAMEMAAQLCPSPAVMIEPTMPALVHSVGTAHDTVALDEVDVYFGGSASSAHKAARAIINAGYSGTGCYRRMYKGEAQKVPCFGAMMMAGLGNIRYNPDLEAMLTRCHSVFMKCADAGYRAPRYDREAQFAAQLITERLTLFAQQNLDAMASHVPDVPGGLKPREAEIWEPLLSVAHFAGGDWPAMAMSACEEMVATGGQPPEDEDKLRELDDIMASWGTEADTLSEED